MTLQKCLICKSSLLNEIGLAGVKYYCCEQCKTMRLMKFPEPVYKKKYYKGNSFPASILFKPVATFFYKIREHYTHASNINLWIDIGAGDGDYLKIIKAKRKIGVEISDAGRKLMQETGIKTMTPKEFLASNNLNADVISFWHVLEHMEKPWYYLQAAKRNLAPKGKIVIGVPNIESFEYKIFKNNWFHLAPKYHFWHFSVRSVKILLNSTGYRVDKIDYLSVEHQTAGILQSLINSTSNSKNVLHKLIKRGMGTEKIFTKDLVSICFWITFGLPIVLIFWLIETILHRSGTIVVVASPTIFFQE